MTTGKNAHVINLQNSKSKKARIACTIYNTITNRMLTVNHVTYTYCALAYILFLEQILLLSTFVTRRGKKICMD